MKIYDEHVVNFSRTPLDSSLDDVVNKVIELGEAGLARNYSKTLSGDGAQLSGKEYKELNNEVKEQVLGFMAKACGVKEVSGAQDLEMLFSDGVGMTLFNKIMTQALPVIILGAEPASISQIANVDTVEFGASKTYRIDPKGLYVAQRNSRMSNVYFEDGGTTSTITVTPKVYSAGVQLDYMRMLDKSFDFGRDVAKVAASIIYAQYKLVVQMLFDQAPLNGSMFYNATYTPDDFLRKVEALKALNGGLQPINYGTLPAFHAISSQVTNNNYGFATQDEVVRNAYIGRIHGVDSFVVENVTDGSELLTTPDQLAIPMDMILTITPLQDKPVKLVRENFVKVITKEPTDGALYTKKFGYFMAFDACVATSMNYMLTKIA